MTRDQVLQAIEEEAERGNLARAIEGVTGKMPGNRTSEETLRDTLRKLCDDPDALAKLAAWFAPLVERTQLAAAEEDPALVERAVISPLPLDEKAAAQRDADALDEEGAGEEPRESAEGSSEPLRASAHPFGDSVNGLAEGEEEMGEAPAQLDEEEEEEESAEEEPAPDYYIIRALMLPHGVAAQNGDVIAGGFDPKLAEEIGPIPLAQVSRAHAREWIENGNGAFAAAVSASKVAP